MTNYQILITKDHPLYAKIVERGINYLNYGKFPSAPNVIELCLLDKVKKRQLWESLKDKCILADLSCHNGDALIEEFPQVQGALASAFPSPKQACEYWSKTAAATELLLQFFKKCDIVGVAVDSPGIGFIYPRIISMIINEAYFAREDQVATAQAIDQAMRYGVHYPAGPFALAQKIGSKSIVALLDELAASTGDLRYQVCQQLREESLC